MNIYMQVLGQRLHAAVRSSSVLDIPEQAALLIETNRIFQRAAINDKRARVWCIIACVECALVFVEAGAYWLRWLA